MVTSADAIIEFRLVVECRPEWLGRSTAPLGEVIVRPIAGIKSYERRRTRLDSRPLPIVELEGRC